MEWRLEMQSRRAAEYSRELFGTNDEYVSDASSVKRIDLLNCGNKSEFLFGPIKICRSSSYD